MNVDEQSIRSLVSTWMAETRAGNTPAVLDLMTDDVVFLRPGHSADAQGRVRAGRPGAEVRQAPTFDGKSEIQEVQVHGVMGVPVVEARSYRRAARRWRPHEALGPHAHHPAQGKGGRGGSLATPTC
jgi:hypothetical protein